MNTSLSKIRLAALLCVIYTSTASVRAEPPAPADAPVENAAKPEDRLQLKAHTNFVRTLAFSPDGKILASAGGDGTICLWDIKSGTLIRKAVKAHKETIESIAFSRDGKRLATGGADALVKVWDVETLGTIATLTGHYANVCGVVFSPDGNTLYTSCMDQTVRAWDIENAKALWDVERPGYLSGIDLSTDGKLLVTGAQLGLTMQIPRANGVYVLNAKDGSAANFLQVGESHIGASLIFDNGNKVLCAQGQESYIWDLTGGAKKRLLKARITGTAHAQPVAITPSGNRIAFACDQMISVQDGATGDTVVNFSTPEKNIAVALSPDGTMVAGAGGVKFFNTENTWQPLSDFSVYVWHIDTAVGKDIFAKQESPFTGLVMTPDGKTLISGSTDHMIRQWDVATGKMTGEVKSTIEGNLVLSPDGTLLAGQSSQKASTFMVMNLATGEVLQSIKLARILNPYAAFTPDSKHLLLSGGEHKLSYYAVGQKEPEFTAQVGGDARAISISPDGARGYIVRGFYKTSDMEGVDLKTGKLLDDLQSPKVPNNHEICFTGLSADGKTLIFEDSDNLGHYITLLYDIATGKQTEKGPRFNIPTNKILSQDGKWVCWALDRDGGVMMASLEGKGARGPFKPSKKNTAPPVLSPDGSMVYLACEDGTIRVWQP